MNRFKIAHSIFAEWMGFPAFILAIVYAPSYWWYVLPVTYFLFTGIGVRAGFHALHTHASYDAPSWWKYLTFYLGTISSIGTLAHVAAMHLVHHKMPDTSDDPSLGDALFRIKGGHLPGEKFMARQLVRNMKNPLMKFSLEWSQTIVILTVLFLITTGFYFNDPWVVVFLWLLPAWMTIWGFTLNRLTAHRYVPFNYRRYNTPDKSQNNLLLSLILMGEGLHNNHHAKPRDWKFAHTWWEWLVDWPALFIWLVKR